MSRHAERTDRLRRVLREHSLELLFVCHPANVTYLTGFRGDSSHLLVGHDHLWFITDSRFAEQAQAEAPGCEVVEHQNSLIKQTAATAASTGLRRLAFEEAHLTCASHRELGAELPSMALEPTKDLVENLRAVKDREEQNLIRKTAAAADAAFADVVADIRPGRTELDVASRLEYAMQQHGCRKPSFDTIVAAGPRASLPHAESTHAEIQPGDPVLVDWGGVRDLYCSDATRVVHPTEPDDLWREVYTIVLAAQERAIQAIRDGVPIRDVDAAARSHIADAGYGGHFGHGLGHGVGLQVHEAPRLHAKSDGILSEGMVVTIEPGIYLPGQGGVRIEDLVLVCQDGPEILTTAPKNIETACLSE
ncbi:MAG: aminopeptidase P family protein [Candidatus Brocadiae bacterium]|nr:aminopeptidase P family protein [Candidatus Brocadiia bacterium]